MIVIIDCNLGNLASIANMLEYMGIEAKISGNPDDIESASKLILPGVGAFDHGMDNLHSKEILDLLNKRVLIDEIPILGICLGMQLLCRSSEEGVNQGLGWIQADVKRFNQARSERNIKIPHMGWESVEYRPGSILYNSWDLMESRFYFTHSYHVVCDNDNDVSATAYYGYNFTASIEKNNIFGTQYHPEKSHKYGMKILKNFCAI